MALQAEPYINMLLRSVQHMGHSDALKKFYLTLIFNLFLQQYNNIFSKKMILNCIVSKRTVLESSPSSDRYSAQSHRWISVFHCRPEIEINRMTTIDKLLFFWFLWVCCIILYSWAIL